MNGGKNPNWRTTPKSVFTFYVPATVTLDQLSIALIVVNENIISNTVIGTTGSIPLAQVSSSAGKYKTFFVCLSVAWLLL